MYMYIMISFRLPSLTGLDPGRPRSWELLQALTSHAPWRPRMASPWARHGPLARSSDGVDGVDGIDGVDSVDGVMVLMVLIF